MNAAKHAQKLKHIGRIKKALRYRENEEKRLAPIKKEKKETKNYIVAKLRHNHANIREDILAARRKAREDWKLGALRPNRAIGEEAETYGTLDREQLRGVDMPKHWFGAKEGVQKRMKTRIPENVLRDHWPIVEDDRVVVIRGRERNRIGVVKEVLKDSNMIILKDVNKVWTKGSYFNKVAGENQDPKREWENALPYNDVRLVIPHTVMINGEQVRRDVIVEAVDMEKHVSGANPFTGEEDTAIPEEQQVDPVTEQPIWHRYIAGTRTPILWPWETSKQKKLDDAQRKDATNEEKEAEKPTNEEKSLLQKVNPMNLLPGRKQKEKELAEAKLAAQEPTAEDEDYFTTPENVTRGKPRKYEPADYPDDTNRNEVEMDGPEYNPFIPTLLYSPLPPSIAEELSDLKESANKETADREKESSLTTIIEEKRRIRNEKVAAREQANKDRMKTPMQIRWELEQAKKVKYDPTQPIAAPENLLLALGAHMAANGFAEVDGKVVGREEKKKLHAKAKATAN